jgi:hypothetical protein
VAKIGPGAIQLPHGLQAASHNLTGCGRSPNCQLRCRRSRLAGELVLLNMHSRNAPARLRQMAEEMAGSRSLK